MLIIGGLLSAKPLFKHGHNRPAGDPHIHPRGSRSLGFRHQADLACAQIEDQNRALKERPGCLVRDVEQGSGHRHEGPHADPGSFDQGFHDRQRQKVSWREAWSVSASSLQRRQGCAPPSERILRKPERLSYLSGS